jgi:site-specific recombinase XerD
VVTALITAHDDPALLARLDAIDARVRDRADDAKARNTRRGYRSDWEAFTLWCAQHGLEPLPADPLTVARYLTAMAEPDAQPKQLKPSTLARRLAGIRYAHLIAGHSTSPTSDQRVKAVLSGIRRGEGVAPRQVAAATLDPLRSMLVALPNDLRGLRDRAVLLIGFAAALRRSNLVALNVEDLEFESDGVILSVRRSKTDQEGRGTQIGIPMGAYAETCPVRALRGWLTAAQITSGPVFRRITITKELQATDARLTDQSVADIVKRAAAAAGLKPADYAAHSLRAGMATTAARAGASDREIMSQTGHVDPRSIGHYVRKGRLLDNNVLKKLGL